MGGAFDDTLRLGAHPATTRGHRPGRSGTGLRLCAGPGWSRGLDRHGQRRYPARVGVTDARLFLPSRGVPEAAAFFKIVNTGGAQDRPVGVTSSDVTEGISLSSHRMTADGAAYRWPTESLSIPAGGTLDMSSTCLRTAAM